MTELIIIGAVVSLAVELIKKYAGTSKLGTLAIVTALSIIGGVIYYNVSSNAVLMKSIGEVLVIASAIHNLLIRRLEEAE